MCVTLSGRKTKRFTNQRERERESCCVVLVSEKSLKSGKLNEIIKKIEKRQSESEIYSKINLGK